MNYTFSFERLEVWQLAKDLVKDAYRLTKKFPGDERFGLVSQINRATISVVSNIAEGSARTSRKDQAHFSQMAFGSLMESACQLIVAFDLGFIQESEFKLIRQKIEKIANKLNALRNYQINGSTVQRFNR